MKLIVGLGNPGKKYENTRHNSGFIMLDEFINKYNLIPKEKFNGYYYEQLINNEKIILLKPMTYMNLSGECVLKYIKYFNIQVDDVLIIYDDVNFDVGSFKIKRDGSSAGHNGMKNIIDNLKTEKIKRIKIGISKNNIPLEEYVLQKFNKNDLKIIKELSKTISNIIEDFTQLSIDDLMMKYNGK